MTPKDIRPEQVSVVCAVCGRTLLRGEHAVAFLAAGERREVCELCTARARHQGWIREDAQLEVGTRTRRGERRHLLDRFRTRRSGDAGEPLPPLALDPEPAPSMEQFPGLDEPRHVHAVPSSGEMKAEQALDLFNGSDHPRTIAGVARSLGGPTVAVRPVDDEPSMVAIVVAWELCWYRYEVDLADSDSPVRMAEKGHELSELEPADQVANAAADDVGHLALAAAGA
jgi:hypothetical protein